MLQDALNEYTYFAEISGLELEIEPGLRSFSVSSDLKKRELMIAQISVTGFDEKIPVLLRKLFEKMKYLEVKEERFVPLKEKVINIYVRQFPFFQLKRLYGNSRFSQPYIHTEAFWHLILYQTRWTWWEKEKAIQG